MTQNFWEVKWWHDRLTFLEIRKQVYRLIEVYKIFIWSFVAFRLKIETNIICTWVSTWVSTWSGESVLVNYVYLYGYFNKWGILSCTIGLYCYDLKNTLYHNFHLRLMLFVVFQYLERRKVLCFLTNVISIVEWFKSGQCHFWSPDKFIAQFKQILLRQVFCILTYWTSYK